METIRIYTIGNRGNEYVISTEAEFFKGSVKIDIDLDKIVFTKPTLEDVKSYSTQHSGFRRSFKITSYYLQEGEFPIDKEESNEDQLVIYFEDMLTKKQLKKYSKNKSKKL